MRQRGDDLDRVLRPGAARTTDDDALFNSPCWLIITASSWREKYTPEFTKLIVASDPHAPGGVRANGTPTNVDAFAKAFGCKQGDAMINGGDKKVAIW